MKNTQEKNIENIELTDLDGTKTRVEQLLKNDTLLIFDVWTTWCKPCLKAIKEIDVVKKEYKNVVNTISINLDNLTDTQTG